MTPPLSPSFAGSASGLGRGRSTDRGSLGSSGYKVVMSSLHHITQQHGFPHYIVIISCRKTMLTGGTGVMLRLLNIVLIASCISEGTFTSLGSTL